MGNDDKAGLDLLSQYAQRRRDEAEAKESVAAPAHLDKVERSTIIYECRESALPLSQVDGVELVEKLAKIYNLELEPVTTGDLVKQYSSEHLGRLSPADTLALVLKKESAKQATFSRGRFPLKNDFVSIQTVSISRYRLGVAVEGPSYIAETVAEEVAELLWTIVGSRKGFADIESDILGKIYHSVTRIRLPNQPEDLLSTPLKRFIDEHLLDNERYAERMRTNAGDQGRTAAVVRLQNLWLTIKTMNLTSGLPDTQQLAIDVAVHADVGAKLVRISSAMKFEEHMRMIESLLTELDQT